MVVGVRKGAWTDEEDALLRKCIEQYKEGKWHLVPLRAGLNRCRKSCRLRWLNYLRPDLKRGNFSDDEVDLMLRLHNLLGNRWSLIAGRLPGRTGNDVKNYWNTHHAKKPQSKPQPHPETKVLKPQPRNFMRQSGIDNGSKRILSLAVSTKIVATGTKTDTYNIASFDADTKTNAYNVAYIAACTKTDASIAAGTKTDVDNVTSFPSRVNNSTQITTNNNNEKESFKGIPSNGITTNNSAMEGVFQNDGKEVVASYEDEEMKRFWSVEIPAFLSGENNGLFDGGHNNLDTQKTLFWTSDVNSDESAIVDMDIWGLPDYTHGCGALYDATLRMY